METLYNKFVQLVNDLSSWLLDAILYLIDKAIALLLNGLAVVIEAIPVPDFLTNFTLYLNGFLAYNGISYMFDLLEIPTGFAIVVASAFLSFIIRRIPFIG